MSNLIDLTGKKFGLLTVINQAPSVYTDDKIKTMWLCKCDCGAYKDVPSIYLRKKDIKTCGKKECREKLKGIRCESFQILQNL